MGNKEINIYELARKNVLDLQPYTTARDDFQGEANTYLDANENPYPSDVNRYPDPHQKALKQKLGAMKNVSPDQIFVGNGSDEVVDLLFRAFCEPGRDEVLITQPTYGMYAVSAGINDVKLKQVPLTNDFQIDPGAILEACTQHTKILFLCHPNNPSGNTLNLDAIRQVLDAFPGLVAIDEAYIDFAEGSSTLPWLSTYPNLVVMQTLSKAWGLAGIRLGMGFGNHQVIELLNKLKPPYNISALNQQAALRALDDPEKVQVWIDTTTKERERLLRTLPDMGVVQHVYPSETNFLLVRTTDARYVYSKLLEQGIVVRDRSSLLHCTGCLRMTVGTPEENDRLINALKKL